LKTTEKGDVAPVEWFSRYIKMLAEVLGDLGVPEAYRTLGALGLLYVFVTLVVFLAIFALFRRLRRRRPGASAIEPAKPEAAPGEIGAPSEQLAPEKEAAEAAPGPASVAAVPAPQLTLLERMRAGLVKTQTSLVGRIDALLGAGKKVDADLLEELEEILITADLGMKTTRELMVSLEKRFAGGDRATSEALRRALQEEIGARLHLEAAPIDFSAAAPFVIMVVGVNGVGKTTTIGKLAHHLVSQGKKVVLGAGDTFRAAAAEQLAIWGERSGVDVIRHDEGSDPAAVAFDAARAAVARRADVLILDTAGRLHTKVNLMEELKKVRRVLDREIPGAPHETLLVLDATTGQNALVQARLFKETVAITGIALTKLDGTARGGIVVAIGCELNLPVRFVGIGEGIDDLRPFDPDLFVEALFQRD
jgi:fused signal recognition particle receptor